MEISGHFSITNCQNIESFGKTQDCNTEEYSSFILHVAFTFSYVSSRSVLSGRLGLATLILSILFVLLINAAVG